MLRKTHRLLKESEFERVFKNGRSFYVKELGMKCAKGDGPTRFGFSLSTKVSKKAVERNRIKRQLREIVRAELPRVAEGYECVFVVKPEIKELSFEEKKERVITILTKMRILRS